MPKETIVVISANKEKEIQDNLFDSHQLSEYYEK